MGDQAAYASPTFGAHREQNVDDRFQSSCMQVVNALFQVGEFAEFCLVGRVVGAECQMDIVGAIVDGSPKRCEIARCARQFERGEARSRVKWVLGRSDLHFISSPCHIRCRPHVGRHSVDRKECPVG